MLELTETAEGIILPVQAQPRAKRVGVTGVHAGRLKVAVAEPPEQGKANAAIIRVLAEALQLKRLQIEITAGASSSHKRFLVTGVDRAVLQNRLNEILQIARNSG
ncbi:MAG: DUF167 domain-containing protein [Planctomycetaceae bacterium]